MTTTNESTTASVISDMSTHVNDGQKHYLIEGNQVVAAADSKEALTEREAAACKDCGDECEGEYCDKCTPEKKAFTIGDRVEIAGRLGTVKSIITSVYGDVAGVKLDNGSIEEALTTALAHADVEEPTYETAVEALISEFKAYEQVATAGIDDIRVKAAAARQLNLRAKALVTDPKLALSERVQLDTIVLQTGVDIVELKDDEQILATASYIEELPRYEMDFGNSNPHHSEDASWLLEAAERVNEDIAATDWDAHLAVEAVELVDRMSSGLVDDEDYVKSTALEHFAHLGAEGERKEQFLNFVRQASASRIESLAKVAAQKTASVEVDPDLPDEALFL